MVTPQLAIPLPELIRDPVSAIKAATTVFISANYGVEAINKPLPGDGEFIDWMLYFVKNGDEEFANQMAVAMHEMESEDGAPSFVMRALCAAAEAGVYLAKGATDYAWHRASYAAMLLGVMAGLGLDPAALGVQRAMTSLSAKGVHARHAKNRQLREFAVTKYRARSWASANDAANQLKAVVMAEGEKIGMRLMDSNAQRTIAEWFREADKAGNAT